MPRTLRSLMICLLVLFAASTVVLTACASPEDNDTGTDTGNDAGTDTNNGDDPPAPVVAMTDRGLDIVGSFDAPGGLTGYAARFQGRPIALYVTEDDQHAVIGTLIDKDGNDLSSGPLERMVAGPGNEEAWEALADSTWVIDGDPDAERVVYEITDPNCPYCHQFWQLARPWVESGAVQIRHVMVGILKQDSVAKAAAIVAADDPEAALERNQNNFDSGGVATTGDIPRAARDKVQANTDLMQRLGYFATPTILYRKDDGSIGSKNGLPRGDDVEKILGPKP